MSAYSRDAAHIFKIRKKNIQRSSVFRVIHQCHMLNICPMIVYIVIIVHRKRVNVNDKM